MKDEMNKARENSIGRSIPRNPNMKVSDDEIEALLALAAEQVAGESADRKSTPKSDVTKGVLDKHEQALTKKDVEKKQEEAAKKEAEAKKKLEELQKKEAAEKKKREEEAKKKLEAIQKEEAKKKEIAEKQAAAKKEIEDRRKKEAEARAQLEKLHKQEEEELKASIEREKKKQEEEKRKETQEWIKEQKAAKENAKEKTSADKNSTTKKTNKKATDNKAFNIEEPFVIKQPEVEEEVFEDKWTVGRVIGTFMEGLWTVVKIAVVISVITAISGFFLSRDLMIRGRSGNRQCTEDMVVAANVFVNQSAEDGRLDKWLSKAKREKVTLEADDKKILVARKVVTKKDGNKWAVVLHGYNGSMEDVYDIAMRYSKEGYNVLMPDLRACGESEGSFYGMGWLDRLDVINWVDVILKENPSAEVVIHGVDMGADTALMLSGEPLKDNIKAIVADGAYSDAWSVVKKEYKLRHPKLPTFPFLYMINPVMKVWAGYSLFEANAVSQVKVSKVPTLIIHGYNDTYATDDMTEKLNGAIASKHEVLTIANGAHDDCRYADPDTYYDKVFGFVGAYVK